MDELMLLALFIRVVFFIGIVIGLYLAILIGAIVKLVNYKKKKDRLMKVVENIATCAIDLNEGKISKQRAIEKTVIQYEDGFDLLKNPN